MRWNDLPNWARGFFLFLIVWILFLPTNLADLYSGHHLSSLRDFWLEFVIFGIFFALSGALIFFIGGIKSFKSVLKGGTVSILLFFSFAFFGIFEKLAVFFEYASFVSGKVYNFGMGPVGAHSGFQLVDFYLWFVVFAGLFLIGSFVQWLMHGRMQKP